MFGFWLLACARIAYSEHLAGLLAHYGSAEVLWQNLDAKTWCRDQRYTASWQRIQKVRYEETVWQQKLAEVQDKGIEVITLNQQQYPALLKEIHAAPLVLFCRGNSALLSQPCVSIVGTRGITSYGAVVTERMVASLVSQNISLVSGLAYGIDTKVHESALHFDLSSIAVIPAALTADEWGGNGSLRSKLSPDKHLFVSETFPDENLQKFHFVKRNRIIAGLSKWTVVVEAAEKSGALITAQYACEEGREVFVVPHTLLAPMGKGCLKLAADGARIMIDTDLGALLMGQIANSPVLEKSFTNQDEQYVYNHIAQGFSLDEMQLPEERRWELVGKLLCQGYIIQQLDGSYQIKN
ncbi:MAG: DNA-protecting protein DprA [Candidatus Abawacabacteria bacterium]|nr:DNA-protecting protein DprA [Candidatus Abawacabacteria bacterium]